ncbi:MAG: DUF5684 domain-containing protein [Ktedonobacterales bacterium]
MASLAHVLLDATTGSANAGAASAIIVVIVLAIAVLYIASSWAIFSKAGQPGLAAIIPIYNTFVLLRVCGRPAWWFILLIIPLVDIVVALIMVFDLAKAFGRGAGFGLGLLFLSIIFYPVLGFGSSRYVGRVAQPVGVRM